MIPNTLLPISSTSASARYRLFVLSWNDLLNITCVNLNWKSCILQEMITSKTPPTEIAMSVSICFARALLKQSQPLPWGSGLRCDDGEIIIQRNQFLKLVACSTVRLKFKHQNAITDVCILHYYKNCSIWIYSDYYRHNSLLCRHQFFYSSLDRIRVSSLSRRVSRFESRTSELLLIEQRSAQNDFSVRGAVVRMYV